MNDNIFVCRSITHAQRMSAAVRRAGINNWISRVPAGLVKSGCGYAVHIRSNDLSQGLQAMQREGIRPVRIFTMGENGYQEVPYDLS